MKKCAQKAFFKVTLLDTTKYYQDRPTHIYNNFSEMCADVCKTPDEYKHLWDRTIANYDTGVHTFIVDDLFFIEMCADVCKKPQKS